MNDKSQSEVWWDRREVPVGEGLRYVIGPLTLQLFRSRNSWRLWTTRVPADETQPSEALVERLTNMPGEEGAERFVFGSSPAPLRLRPMLADRSVVIRARQSVFVPPGEEAILYLSSPVWIALDLGEPARSLREIPVSQLSDTWFGLSTREGELCYAARTHARNHLEQVPRRPHRAVTPVKVRNEASTLLPIEKLNLPVPLLSVYGDADKGLWTEEVHLTRSADSDMAALRVVPGVPVHAPRAERLSGPRTEPGRGGLVRAFTDLFG
ncbi:DUF432 domain-containing protein [Thioalkalivibrio sulfidiphilus]|uniref:DUF432 domain-containing protein n=1 Tax=Thioalkalivibrio sulfidiphilus TaxID=1033854 RepID=UPI003B324127